MTRLSQYLLPTERQPPADAEALSHKLMVRAGMVRQVGAGLWTWLPAGWRVHQKVVDITREEMNRFGALEVLMPVIQPAELWQKSGRYRSPEVFKLQDRKQAEFVLGLSGEEVVTWHMSSLVRSYRDLPRSLYHFQIKGRDEPRPRAGILRTREFVMKDSYSFDRDPEGLDASYELHAEAYRRIYDRCGVEWYQVEADVGMMGGNASSEFMAPCAAGEDDVVLAPGYAANLEVACAEAQPVELPEAASSPREIATPGVKTIEALAQQLDRRPGTLLKAFPIVLENGDEFVLVLVRGDHSVNETKLGNRLGAWRQATPEEISEKLGPPGSLGPVGATVRVVLDAAVETGGGGYVVGANRPDMHLTDVVPGRDFTFEQHDIRTVLAGDTVNGQPLRIEAAIEIGNIFKLGTHYSSAERLNATYLDQSGTAQEIWMGCYGLGPARVVAAVVEQYADAQGISWPRAIAPFDLHLVSLGKPGSEEREAGERIYAELQQAGLDVIYDDRDSGPGEKFADAELLGCPLRVTAGRKALAAGELEVQVRRGQESRSVPLEGAGAALAALWSELP